VPWHMHAIIEKQNLKTIFFCHLISDSWCNHPLCELWSVQQNSVKCILVAIKNDSNKQRKRKKEGERKEKKEGGEIVTSHFAWRPKQILVGVMQTLLVLVESHISSHHITGQLGDMLLLSFYLIYIYIYIYKRFLLSLPCSPIILLAPAPIIRHVDSMWLPDFILHNHPPDHAKLQGKDRGIVLFGMFSCRLQTKKINVRTFAVHHLHKWGQISSL
jgi:hypothetical protein